MKFPRWHSKNTQKDVDDKAMAEGIDAAYVCETGGSGEPSDVQPTEVADQVTPERGAWTGRLDFLMACIGYAVGLGNVWRFPYLCYMNGGGAFLIPYGIMLCLLGLPVFFLEFAFGQFASLGPISVWNMSPLFKGIGYGMIMVSWILVIYYQVVVTHCMFYFISSFTSVLPWQFCGQYWNSPNCSHDNTTVATNFTKGPSEEYFYGRMLDMSPGIDDFGAPRWELALLLLGAWVICCLALIKGVQSMGKVVYFTSLFPYIMLTCLLIQTFLLPGTWEGIKFYVTPKWHLLAKPEVWTAAATQIFFSLGCCNGSLIAMSSFNKFKHNCCRDAVIVAIINCATSVYAGFVIFGFLGYMANMKGTTVDKVASSGPGLAFIVYPEALTTMKGSMVWSVLFFLMMCCLGFGTQFSILETVISGLQDELRRVGFVFTGTRDVIFRISICTFNFLLGLPMVCRGGFYLLSLIDNSLSGYPLLILCLFEVVVICHVYGLKQFRRDIEQMISERPNWYWRIMWSFVTPIICLVLIIFLMVESTPYKLDAYEYPNWAHRLWTLIAISPPMMIPIWMAYKYCREGGFILLRESLKPAFEWGPAQFKDRTEFIDKIRSRSNGQMNPMGTIIPVNASSVLQLNGQQFGGSVISGLANTGILDETGFFQSKLSVAEKLTQAHTKELVKRVASQADFIGTDALPSSQMNLGALGGSSQSTYLMGQSQLVRPLAALGIISNSAGEVGEADDDDDDEQEGEKGNSNNANTAQQVDNVTEDPIYPPPDYSK